MALRALIVASVLCAVVGFRLKKRAGSDGTHKAALDVPPAVETALANPLFGPFTSGPLTSCTWMWRDAGLLPIPGFGQLAKWDGARWGGKTAEECAEMLETQAQNATNSARPVRLVCSDVQTNHANVRAAIAYLTTTYLKDHFAEWGSDVHDDIGPPLYKKGFNAETLLRQPTDGSTTVFELVQKAVMRGPARRAVGSRGLKQVHIVEGFEKLELENEYHWLSYEMYWARIQDFSNGLRKVTGIEAQAPIVIYAETSADWMTSAIAAFSANLKVVTIYATLGKDGAEFGMKQTNAEVVIADRKLLKIVKEIVAGGNVPTLKYLITLDPIEDTATKQALEESGVTVQSFHEVVEIGRSSPMEPRPPTPEDVAVVMYTSGTTGRPKGVLITHSNLVAAVAGFEQLAKGSFKRNSDTVYLAYLPLAHIMEVVAELSVLMMGGSMGYGSPHTMLDSGVKLYNPEKDKVTTMPDALLVKPNFMVFPPAVLNKVFGAVMDGYAATKASAYKIKVVGGIASGALDVLRAMQGDAKMFASVKSKLGGNVQLIVSGSAPLSKEIADFVSEIFGAPVRQGYGLTENCACAAAAPVDDTDAASVGAPTASTVIRLRDWPEGGYKNSDVATLGLRRGEILVGGPSVSIGYIGDPHDESLNAEIQKKNAEEFLEIAGERYFATGDIGAVDFRGTLRIVDRKKDLWKGPNGEYVSMSKVEKALSEVPLAEFSMAYGKTGEGFIVALIVAKDKALSIMGAQLGKGEEPPAKLAENPDIVKMVFAEVAQACKGLQSFEKPNKIAVLPQGSWTPENDMLTAALKLKRPQIVERFKAQIDSLYSR